MDNRRPIDSVHLSQYYGINKPPYVRSPIPNQPKKQISRPTPSKRRNFKNRTRKIIAALALAGTIVIGGIPVATTAILNEVQETIQENQEISAFAKTFDSAINSIYNTSEFLQVSLRKTDFSDYVKHIVELRLKEESFLMDLIENENINQEALLYLITGEKCQGTTFSEQDISNILSHIPLNQKISFDKKGSPKKPISCLAQIANICEGQNKDRFYKELLPSILGRTSISCGIEATKYRQDQILETLGSIEQKSLYIPQLQGNIAMNKDSNQKLIKAYAQNLYNPIIQSANDIQKGEAFNNIVAPSYLKNLTKEVARLPVVSDSYNLNKFSINEEVANYEDFLVFRETRNNYYMDCIGFAKDPNWAITTLNSELSSTCNYINNLESTDNHTLKDLYSLVTSHEKDLKNNQELISHKSSFDFSR